MSGQRVALSAALTSLSQAAGMIAGAVLAVIVAARFGTDARTDGFFAAYGVYGLAVLFALSVRTTIVARLVESGDSFEGLDRFVGAGVVIVAAVGVAFAALGSPLASLLTGDLPGEAQEVARTALLVLWPAMACQLFAALGAAMLGVLGRFGLSALAFAGGGVVSIAAFLALEPALGIDGLAVSILVGSAVTAAVVAGGLLRIGWRPSAGVLGRPRAAVRDAGLLVTSSLSFLLAQIGFLVTISVAARLGEGVLTIYSYAYSGLALVTALLASSVSIVLAAPIAATWDRRPASLRPHHEAVTLTGLLLLAPVVAAVWLLGDEVGDLVLARFTPGEVDLTVELFLLLSPAVAWAVALGLPQTALFTLGRYGIVAVVSAAVVAVHVVVSLLAGALDSVRLLALAVPISSLCSVVALCALVYGPLTARVLGALGLGVVRLCAVAFAAFALPALAAHAADAPGADAIGVAAGIVLFAGATMLVLPRERELGARLVASVTDSARRRPEPIR